MLAVTVAIAVHHPEGGLGLVNPILTGIAYVLLVVVAIVGVVKAVRRHGTLGPSAIVALALWVAAAGFLTFTPGHSGRLNLVPFDFGASATPFEPVSNVLLFVPLGILLAALGRRALVVVGIGFAASLAIETTQYLLDTGRTADIDDLIENTLGALIGWLIVAAVVARRKDAVD